MSSSRFRASAFICFAWVMLLAPDVLAQQNTANQEPVTREEFNRLLEEFRAIRADHGRVLRENGQLNNDVASLRSELSALKNDGLHQEFERTMQQERQAILQEVRQEIDERVEPLSLGMTNFALGGGFVVNFQDRDDADSTFGVGIAPILLWKPTERLLLEAEVAIGLSGEESFIELDYAQISYVLNDYVTVGAGKFLMPFGTFWERWHPSWINKLPTLPQIYAQGLMGQTGLGIQVRGGAEIGPTKINYAAYFINGPEFRTSFASAGMLGFNNHRDNNNGKAFGGRIGFLPIPELEIGYSIQSARAGDSGSPFSGVDTIIQGVDLTFAKEIEEIKGRLDIRGEFIWSDTDDEIFFGPFPTFTYDNKRNGWFLQAAYRPTMIDYSFGDGIDLKDFEFVARYDQIRQPGPGALGVDRDQLTLGIDYWIRPNVVLKAAYVFDDAHGGSDQDGFFMQLAIGM